MKRGASASAMAILAALVTATSARADADRVRSCVSPSQAHELLIQQKFIAPFRALAEAVRSSQAEAVGVQLCRLSEAFVYDVTLLQRDGRVSHSLVNARTGVLVNAGRPVK